MPTETTEAVRGYAHCTDNECPGNAQQPVDATRITTNYSYADMGGDMPGIERSTTRVQLVDEAADAACEYCGRIRDLSDQVRPSYPNLSNSSQRALIDMQAMSG